MESPDFSILTRNLIDRLKTVEDSIDGVTWEKENFLQLREYLSRLVLIITEVGKSRDQTSNIVTIVEVLLRDVETANELVLLTRKSRIYLLTHCRLLVNQLKLVTNSIGRTVGLLPLSAVDGRADLKQTIDSLAQAMQMVQYKVQEIDERINRHLEQDQDVLHSDISVKSGIVMDIAHTLGLEDLPQNPGALKDQMELLRNDSQEREAYDLRMIDVVGDLFKSWEQIHDQPIPSSENQQRLHARIEPLYDAFVCPLTKQMMVDPVTLENGQTFERSAIERWFAQCEDDKHDITCPTTGQVLRSTDVKPSIALRNTIEEWTTRNESARIDNAYSLISSENCAEEDLLYALKDLQSLVLRHKINKYRIRSANGLIHRIVELLKSTEKVRVKTLIMLRLLADDDDDNKEEIVEAEALRSILKCLARSGYDERQEAATLLYELSKSETICEQMGSMNGMILYLVGVTSSKSDNILAVENAELTLDNLEKVDSNVRQLAENGRVQPLLKRLVKGPQEKRLEMANDLGSIPLTTDAKILVAEQGAGVLVSMLEDQNYTTRECSLKVLKELSKLESNGRILVDAGILPPLMRDLFMVGATYSKMKEVCATVLANVVMTSGDWSNIPIDPQGNTLISEPIVHNILHLISNTGPMIEAKLLLVLVGLASSPLAVANLVSYIRSAGAIISLIQFLEAPQDHLRMPAIRLLYLLSTHMGQELADGLRVTTRQLGTLVKLLSTSGGIIEEQAAASGLIANLPVEDFQLTRSLREEGALPALVRRIGEVRSRNVKIGESRFMSSLQEGLVTILARFTYMLEDRDVANLAREYDLTTFFTALLQNTNLDEVQRQCAIALEKLSAFTPRCVTGIPPQPEVKGLAAWCVCFKPPPPPVGICPVHNDICSPKETFCLVEAKSLEPLVSCLDHHNYAVIEAALAALSTLVMDNVDHAKGAVILDNAGATQPVLDIMQEHRTQLLRQRAVFIAERLLRNQELAQQIAMDQNVHTGLVDALRHGNHVTKPMAEKSLKHLNRIPNFSGVFTKTGPRANQRPPGY